jgi:signal transduction histidine kinase
MMNLKQKISFVNILFVMTCVFFFVWFLLSNENIFSNRGFMPHGHCYLWTPALVWTMIITDTLIGLSYVAIALCLYLLVCRIHLPFSSMFLAFGAFIAACGATHFMGIYTLWFPNYWLDAFIKIVTAVASVATAVLIFPVFPRIIGFAAAAKLSEERKQKLEALNSQLELQSEALMVANRELEAFSYSVSHDLRTPLRGIDGFSQALIEDYGEKLDETGKEYLQHVRSGAQQMGRLIDDLLNLSRITKADMVTQKINLTDLSREVFEHLKTLYPDRRIELTLSNTPNVEGDLGLLRVVIDNLASNAWKFTSKQIGAQIEFGSKEQSGETVFFMRDNGAGFDMKFATKLFGPFQRLHSAEEFDGTGIGLATAKRILDRHSGKIWVESEIGKGTTFYFTLGGSSGKT